MVANRAVVQRIHQPRAAGGLCPGFSRKKTELFVFRIFKLTARFSKYDFWNLGKISDRSRKKSIKKNQAKKKLSKKSKKYFSRPNVFRKTIDEKVNEKRKF